MSPLSASRGIEAVESHSRERHRTQQARAIHLGPLATSPVVAAPIVTRFGVRPLIFFGGGYLVLTDLAPVPIIGNLEWALQRQREKAARAADDATAE